MQSVKVLVVEHDKHNLEFVEDALTVLEHHYQVAASLTESYHMLEGPEQYAYILLADEVPLRAGRKPLRQNAENFMARLAKIRAGRRPPVILMVGQMNGVSDIDKMRRAADLRSRGVVDFIENPLPNGGRTLERVVTKVLEAQAERVRLARLEIDAPVKGNIIPLGPLPPVIKQAMHAACDVVAAKPDAPAAAGQSKPAAGSATKRKCHAKAATEAPAGVNGKSVGALTTAERNILEALSERPEETKLLLELVTAGGYSKNTTRKSVERLVGSGYASRPCGPRGGYAISRDGLLLLGKVLGDKQSA